MGSYLKDRYNAIRYPMLVYWLGGATRLWTGHVRLRIAGREIDKGIAGSAPLSQCLG